jgi:hypothetical protein
MVKCKNMRNKLFWIFCLTTIIVQAQKKRCGTDELNFHRLQQNPALIEIRANNEERLQKTISEFSKKRLHVIIPVVVHVIYNADNENISDDQISSQIDALNRDYNLLNSDTLTSNHPFHSLVGNVGIQFELAKFDPNGKPTNGITRTKTNKLSWGSTDLDYDNMKFTSTGGIENWNPKNYLNIYSVRFADSVGLLGYAYYPEDVTSDPDYDGVVIDFRCFGTNGTSGIEGFDVYKLGRTATHEVGHWLGLRHIWGEFEYTTDKKCGDDLVSDTPPAEGSNSGIPTFPHLPNNHCGSDANGEMFMNYMDYVNDKAMVMFSKGQVARMLGSISTYRKNFIQNNTTRLEDLNNSLNEIINLYPNPVQDKMNLTFLNEVKMKSWSLYDMVGKQCSNILFDPLTQSFDAHLLDKGNYILEIQDLNGGIKRFSFVKE